MCVLFKLLEPMITETVKCISHLPEPTMLLVENSYF